MKNFPCNNAVTTQVGWASLRTNSRTRTVRGEFLDSHISARYCSMFRAYKDDIDLLRMVVLWSDYSNNYNENSIFVIACQCSDALHTCSCSRTAKKVCCNYLEIIDRENSQNHIHQYDIHGESSHFQTSKYYSPSNSPFWGWEYEVDST